MGVADLRQKSIPDLKKDLESLLRQRFKLRILKSSGELKQNHQVKQVRRNIARIMTLITEKQGGAK